MASDQPSSGPEAFLEETPLAEVHRDLGARMVAFAGYAMPVQYEGIIAEHVFTRRHAGLFDVSHMGQCTVRADDGKHETIARWLETLVPADLVNLPPGRQRYTQLLNAEGGIIDDLMVARSNDPKDAGALHLVVNAARKAVDFALLDDAMTSQFSLKRHEERALIALQGPDAAMILAQHAPDVAKMPFMGVLTTTFDGRPVTISRSGYTGEDGYEISVSAAAVVSVWSALTRYDKVKPVGLGARDSLRLEAGLCLYGHDIDETTSPIEAGLLWSIQPRRRAGGGFPGSRRILAEIIDGPSRLRVGLRPEGRQPVREGAAIFAGDIAVGTITSGGFGPSVQGPVAMGYVASAHAAEGTVLEAEVRGKRVPMVVAPLPFVPHRYVRPKPVAAA